MQDTLISSETAEFYYQKSTAKINIMIPNKNIRMRINIIKKKYLFKNESV